MILISKKLEEKQNRFWSFIRISAVLFHYFGNVMYQHLWHICHHLYCPLTCYDDSKHYNILKKQTIDTSHLVKQSNLILVTPE